MAALDHPTLAPTLAELAQAFLQALDGQVRSGTLSENTLAGYRIQIGHLLNEMPSGTPPDLRVDQVIGWHLIGRPKITPHLVRAAKRLFIWADKVGLWKGGNPFERIHTPKDGQRNRILQRTEMVRLYRVLSRSWRWFVLVQRHTTMRPGELRTLRWQDVDVTSAQITLTKFKAKERRKDRLQRRSITLVPIVLRHFSRLKERLAARPDDFVFLNRRGKPLTSNAVRCAFRRARARAGLVQAGEEQIVCYSVRHTSATHYTVTGLPQKLLAEHMGHTSTRTTERYQHIASKHVSDAIRAAQERDRQGRSKRAGSGGKKEVADEAG